jgi:hypothetical protein
MMRSYFTCVCGTFGWPTLCMMSSPALCSAQSFALNASGRPLMSLMRSPPCGSTAGDDIAAPGVDGKQRCVEAGLSSGHFSRKGSRRSISSGTLIASRFVRALSAPMSMMSAPSWSCCFRLGQRGSGSSVPSPQNESSLMFTIPITSGRRGNSMVCWRARRIMAGARFDADVFQNARSLCSRCCGRVRAPCQSPRRHRWAHARLN